LFLAGCTNTAYDTGDSRYSYLRTDFADAQTNNSGQLVSAVTDESSRLTFTKPLAVSWKTTADSISRVMLYYNLNADASDSSIVEPLTAQYVYTLVPAKATTQATVSTDPVHFVSAWKSGNGAYLNFCVGVMTGKADSVEARQMIGLVLDSIAEKDHHPTYYLRFAHSQGNVPEYYTTNIYLSIPTKKMTTGSRVRLSLNTYKGWTTREFEW
jgi:translation initiation factor 2B subunit (eIF-2B alpha/beta/delta family)